MPPKAYKLTPEQVQGMGEWGMVPEEYTGDAPHDYGTAINGNLPFMNQYAHELLKKAQKNAAIKYHDKTLNRVAGFTPTQLSAQTAAKDILRTSANTDAIDTARREIKGTFGNKAHSKVKPELEAATRSPLSIEDRPIFDSFDKHYKNLRKTVLDEMTENYVKKLKPKVDYAFMQHGLWNTSLRPKHKDEVLSNLQRDTARDLTKMGMDINKQAFHEVGAHKTRKLQAAELAGNLINRENENANVGAQNLAAVEKSHLLNKIAGTDIANKIGAEEQAQEEAKLKQAYEHQQEEREAPHIALAREVAVHRGAVAPMQLSASKAHENLRPNLPQVGAGLLGQAYQMMQPQKSKKGGQIKSYAEGGHVVDPRHNQEMDQMLAQYKEQEGNPQAEAIGNMGAHLLATHGQNPINALGSGFKVYNHTMKSHQHNKRVQLERAMNLMKDIQRSRFDQQDTMLKFKEMQRLHDAQIAQAGASANYHNAAAKQFDTPAFLGAEGSSKEVSRFLPRGAHESEEYKQQIRLNAKSEEEAKKKIDSLISADNSISLMEDAFKKGIGATGPIPGHLPNWLATTFSGKTENRREFEQQSIKSVLDEMAAMKGVQSDKDLAYIQRTAPSLTDEPETIQTFLKNSRAVINRQKEAEAYIDEATKHGMSRHEAEKEFQKWAMKNPLFGENVKKSEDKETQSSSMIDFSSMSDEQLMKKAGLA
jgi:hypothetical protein